MDKKPIVVLWSGGIDSTGVVGNLLKQGRDVILASVGIYDDVAPLMAEREKNARFALFDHMDALGYPGRILSFDSTKGDWIWKFSPDGKEIPRRNRYLMDYLICRYMIPKGLTELALGEYIGADTWLVRDHVGAADADARALASYLFLEWGLDYRLWTLSDFGEARYKSDRVRLLIQGVGEKGAALTTNCMENVNDRIGRHCGKCYKCVERAAAFDSIGVEDKTKYLRDPRQHRRYALYMRQMKGENVQASMKEMGW